MGSRTALTLLSGLVLLVYVPGGQCILSSIMESLSKTGAQAQESAAELGQASLETVMTGTKGLHKMVKFATDTITDYHTNTLDSIVGGHKKAAAMIDDGIIGLVEMGQKIGVQVVPQTVRETTYSGTKRAGKHGVELAKSGVNVLNKAATGTTKTLRTALQESAGRVLLALPKTPVITPLVEMPYNLAHSTLDALTEMADDSAQNTKNILDKLRPDDGDAD